MDKGIPVLGDAFVVIVATEWNEAIVAKQIEGAAKVFEKNHVTYKVVMVPGAVEIPFAIASIKAQGSYMNEEVDAFVAFGAVIRGGTPHFEYVCKTVAEGVSHLNLEGDIPVIFGVLTLDNVEQAWERLGGQHGHKGEEAAFAAIKMIELDRSIKNPPFGIPY